MPGHATPPSAHTTLLMLRDLAAAAGVSTKTLQREIRAGQLLAVRVGNQVRVRLSDWQAYLEARRIAPGGTARANARIRLAQRVRT